MTHKFIVAVPGRAQPLCIEADSFDRDGWNDAGFTFRQGTDVVAQLPVADLVAKAGSLPGFPAQLKGPDDALALPEPARLVAFAEPLPLQASTGFSCWAVPVFWPFLSGVGLGFIGGVGLVLSRLGVW